MGEKIKRAKEYRAKMQRKWSEYDGPITPDVVKKMEEDNETLKKLGKEATLEWLEEERQKKKREKK